MEQTTTRRQAVNFVTPDPNPVETTRADIIRRSDVMHVIDTMLDTYQQQQRAALEAVQHDAQRGGYLSDAAQVAERRKTSRLYLFYYTMITGMVAGGLVMLAHGAGYLDAGGSFATWLALTGALALLLGWKRHGDELLLTPESIALRVVDAHENVALYESETRRLAIKWEHGAEARRQAAQERAAEYARQQAQLRIDELDARRKAIEAQRAQADTYADRFRVQWGTESPQTLHDGAGRAQAALQVSSIADDAESPTGGATGDSGRPAQTWQQSLLTWVAGLYDDGAMTEAGIIRQRVPWSQRSSWTERDKREAKRVCCDMRPQLIVQADGGRWRLRKEMFTDVDQALQVLSQRLVGD